MKVFANTFFEYLSALIRDRIIFRLFVALISIDVAFILIDSTRRLASYFDKEFYLFSSVMFDIGHDRGYPEIYTYFKIILVIIILCHSYLRFRDSIYGSWAFVYLVALLDDALRLHETFGQALHLKFDFPTVLGLRGPYIGEFAAFAALGLPIAGALYYGFSRSTGIHKTIGQMLGVFLFLLAFFAVGMDILHSVSLYVISANSDSREVIQGSQLLLTILEDGGEMVTLSVTCCFMVAVGRNIVMQAERKDAG